MGEQHSFLWRCDDGAGEHCRKSKLQRESPDAAFDHVESETFVKLPEEEESSVFGDLERLGRPPPSEGHVTSHWNTLASLLSPLTADFKNKKATLKGTADLMDAGNYRGHREKL